jgi:hypothetical protein
MDQQPELLFARMEVESAEPACAETSSALAAAGRRPRDVRPGWENRIKPVEVRSWA